MINRIYKISSFYQQFVLIVSYTFGENLAGGGHLLIILRASCINSVFITSSTNYLPQLKISVLCMGLSNSNYHKNSDVLIRCFTKIS